MAKLTFEAILKILTTVCNILLMAVKIISGQNPDSDDFDTAND